MWRDLIQAFRDNDFKEGTMPYEFIVGVFTFIGWAIPIGIAFAVVCIIARITS